MKNRLSASDLSTYKRWLAATFAAYFSLGAAIVLVISWDVAQRSAATQQTASHLETQTRSKTAISYNR